jgi:hypothetical protein
MQIEKWAIVQPNEVQCKEEKRGKWEKGKGDFIER